VQPSYEFFDHTADMGIRVRASSMSGLLLPTAQGLYAAIGELATIDPPKRKRIDFTSGAGPEYLLRDFLTELLLMFERGDGVVTEIADAALDDHHLSATLAVRAIDDRRSVYFREVKAITYHELEIRPISGGYEATLIVDI